jgi:uncharacterized protein YxjI
MALENNFFPIDLQFKVLALGNEFRAIDANGIVIAYAKQKILKLKEEVNIFSDEAQTTLLCQINANKWLDFSATYQMSGANGAPIGKIGRKGWASMWKAHYELFDERDQQDLIIREENPMAKVFDALLGEVPILNLFTGYLFHPKYIVKRPDGTEVVRLTKKSSMFGRKFTLNQLNPFEQGEELRVIYGLTMMIMLERRRG